MTAAGALTAAPDPIIFKQATHGLREAIVRENHGGPTRFCEHRVQQGYQAAFVVEESQFHGQLVVETDFDACFTVILQSAAVFIIDGSEFDEKPARNATRHSFADKLLIKRIDCEWRARELGVLLSRLR